MFLFILIILGVVLFSVSKSRMDRVEGLKDQGEKIYHWFSDKGPGKVILQTLTLSKLRRELGTMAGRSGGEHSAGVGIGSLVGSFFGSED